VTDRYTKTVLTVIALSLALIAVRDLAPTKPAYAQDDSYLVRGISQDLQAIASGTCTNSKICH
jgi:hypothetical protein